MSSYAPASLISSIILSERFSSPCVFSVSSISLIFMGSAMMISFTLCVTNSRISHELPTFIVPSLWVFSMFTSCTISAVQAGR